MAAFHRHLSMGPVCGAARGVDAADMDPAEVTCKRCKKMPPEYWRGQHYEYRDGRTFLVTGLPDESLPPHRRGVS